MLTPAHLPELERLLASLVDAYEATNVESGIALRTGDEGAFTVASMRLDCAARSLVAFTRAAQSAPPAPVDGPGWRIATDGGGWPRAALGGTWDRPDLAVSADGEDLYVGEHEVPIDIVLAVLPPAPDRVIRWRVSAAVYQALADYAGRLGVELHDAIADNLIGQCWLCSEPAILDARNRPLCEACVERTGRTEAPTDEEERRARDDAEERARWGPAADEP